LFGEKRGRRRWCGGGVMVVVVVGMEEEMEEKKVEELVVEMEVGMVEHGRPIGRQGLFLWLPFSLAAGNKEEERKNNERERKKVGVYI